MNDIDLNCEPLQAFVGDRISNSLAFHASGTTGNQNAATWSIPVATACGITMELIDIEGVQTAQKTELAPIERAALALESSKTEQRLLALATKHTSITVVKDKAGREQAHGAYMELMRARTTVEKASKEVREDATKFSKAVIAEAARLVAIVEPEEARLKEARDVWDAEQARIKAEAEAKERARVLAITERIAAIKSYVVLANNCRTSERVAELEAKLGATEMVGFEEFEAEAVMALADTEAHLNRVLANIREQESEAARIKAEQEAEAARLKSEREELDRRRAEAEAQAKAKADADRAELDRQRKEMDAQREAAQAEAKRVADEARAQAEAAEAKVRAAAEAMAAERAELERMRAEIEAKNKPAEIVIVSPEPDQYEQIVAPAAHEPSTPLIKGEVGTVDTGIAIVEVPTTPTARTLVMAIAGYWGTDNKTAARWITERAAEIATLKG